MEGYELLYDLESKNEVLRSHYLTLQKNFSTNLDSLIRRHANISHDTHINITATLHNDVTLLFTHESHRSHYKINLRFNRTTDIFSMDVTVNISATNPCGFDTLKVANFFADRISDKDDLYKGIVDEYTNLINNFNIWNSSHSEIVKLKDELESDSLSTLSKKLIKEIKVGDVYKLSDTYINDVEYVGSKYTVNKIMGKTIQVTYFNPNIKRRYSWSWGEEVTKRLKITVFAKMMLNSVPTRIKKITEATMDTTAIVSSLKEESSSN
jgi:hypothetical protein